MQVLCKPLHGQLQSWPPDDNFWFMYHLQQNILLIAVCISSAGEVLSILAAWLTVLLNIFWKLYPWTFTIRPCPCTCSPKPVNHSAQQHLLCQQQFVKSGRDEAYDLKMHAFPWPSKMRMQACS